MGTDTELIYCKDCREFYEATSEVATHVCPYCKQRRTWKKKLDEALKILYPHDKKKEKDNGSN